MKIILSHGRGGSPNDTLIVLLREIAQSVGHVVIVVDDHDLQHQPEKRAQRLIERIADYPETEPLLLAGFSMGAYTSLLAAEKYRQVRGLFLISPGIYLPHYAQRRYRTDLINVELIHGWSDDVVIYEHALRYAREANAVLHLLPGGHMLLSQADRIEELFRAYLARLEKRLH